MKQLFSEFTSIQFIYPLITPTVSFTTELLPPLTQTIDSLAQLITPLVAVIAQCSKAIVKLNGVAVQLVVVKTIDRFLMLDFMLTTPINRRSHCFLILLIQVHQFIPTKPIDLLKPQVVSRCFMVFMNDMKFFVDLVQLLVIIIIDY